MCGLSVCLSEYLLLLGQIIFRTLMSKERFNFPDNKMEIEATVSYIDLPSIFLLLHFVPHVFTSVGTTSGQGVVVYIEKKFKHSHFLKDY